MCSFAPKPECFFPSKGKDGPVKSDNDEDGLLYALTDSDISTGFDK